MLSTKAWYFEKVCKHSLMFGLRSAFRRKARRGRIELLGTAYETSM